jgi:hypothetical protein
MKYDVYRISVGKMMQEVRSTSTMGAVKKALPALVAAYGLDARAISPVALPQTQIATIMVERIQIVY